MGCRILYDSDAELAAFYCSTSGVAFGPTFSSNYTLHLDAQEMAGLFREYIVWKGLEDPRCVEVNALTDLYFEFITAIEGGLRRCAVSRCDEFVPDTKGHVCAECCAITCEGDSRRCHCGQSVCADCVCSLPRCEALNSLERNAQ